MALAPVPEVDGVATTSYADVALTKRGHQRGRSFSTNSGLAPLQTKPVVQKALSLPTSALRTGDAFPPLPKTPTSPTKSPTYASKLGIQGSPPSSPEDFPSLSGAARITRRQTEAAKILDHRIPVVDMANYKNEATRVDFLKTLFKAMSEVGFFAVRNSGVNVGIVDSAYEEACLFFHQNREQKMGCHNSEVYGQRGFVPSESAKGNSTKDLKEFYHIGREGYKPHNVWPKTGEFAKSMQALYDELDRFTNPLQEAVIAALNQHMNTAIHLDRLSLDTNNGPSLLRMLYYPSLSPEMEGSPWGAAEHTDIDTLAILPRATAEGLEAKIDGKWVKVVAPDDCLIVNVGDFLENMSNGLCQATTHRVRAQPVGQERFSAVFFVHPHDKTELRPWGECIKHVGSQLYGPGTRAAFLAERLIELGFGSNLLIGYAEMKHIETQIKFGRASVQVAQALEKAGLASQEVIDFLKNREIE